jgi:hypothetical protein
MEKKYNSESLGTFEDVFVANKLEATALEVDKILWRGASAAVKYSATTGNLTLCDGFLQVAYANSATTINGARTAMTVANAYVVVDQIVASIAANAPVLLDTPDTNLYLSPADFQTYVTSLRVLNLFHYDASQQSDGISEILHPGAINLKVVKVNGLNGASSGTALCTAKSNIWAVLSDESDLDFKLWFSNDFDALRLMAKLRIGVGFYEPELVLRFN